MKNILLVDDEDSIHLLYREELEEEGYANPLSVEIEFQGEPWPPLKEVHRAMKASYETLKNLGLS